MLVTRRLQADRALLYRLDPAFWHPGYERILAACRVPLAPLGRFIADIAYGPIVTGKQPPARPVSAPSPGWLPVVHQRQVAETGVDLRSATLVPEHSDWDRPRARLRPEEIVLPRSGLGSVAKNRVAIYLDQRPALVGSFVDRIRLAGLDPLYTLLCLKTELVWSQIHRLINGIGTPNISFDEVRSLLIPILPDATQQQLRAAYLADVHSHHLRWLAGDRSARDTALRNFRALAREVDRLAGTAHEST